MFNMIIVTGNVASEPKIRIIKGGQKVMEFCFANNLTNDTVNFFLVNLWQEGLFPYIKKGKLLTVSGEFKIEKYRKADGTQTAAYRISALKIDMVNDNARKEENEKKAEDKKENLTPNDFKEDDIPF